MRGLLRHRRSVDVSDARRGRPKHFRSMAIQCGPRCAHQHGYSRGWSLVEPNRSRWQSGRLRSRAPRSNQTTTAGGKHVKPVLPTSRNMERREFRRGRIHCGQEPTGCSPHQRRRSDSFLAVGNRTNEGQNHASSIFACDGAGFGCGFAPRMRLGACREPPRARWQVIWRVMG